MQKNQTFGEREAAVYMEQLFKAINHCHAQNVIHRDIKPENIMVSDTDSIKLIDFGLSRASRKEKLTEMAGTPQYMAPEVLAGYYHAESDLWSLGVLLYQLVSGFCPFDGDDDDAIFNKIRKAQLSFDSQEFESISEECKDLIRKLIEVRPKKRFTG